MNNQSREQLRRFFVVPFNQTEIVKAPYHVVELQAMSHLIPKFRKYLKSKAFDQDVTKLEAELINACGGRQHFDRMLIYMKDLKP